MEKRGIDLLIFDFDGTLFDTTLDIANAVNFSLKQFGKSELDPKLIWSYTGDGLLNTVKRAFGEENEEIINKAYKLTLKYYIEHSGEESIPIDDVLEFLETDTHRKVILSNKNLEPMLKVLERFNIKDKFERVYGFESLPFIKPDPRTIDYIVQELNLPKDNVAIIGDADQDALTAKNANIRCFIIPSKPITVECCLIFSNYHELGILLENS
jgi:phosphoglycolate phosphatase